MIHTGTIYGRVEVHDTLTANPLVKRPDRQIHDAIYALLAIVQYDDVVLSRYLFLQKQQLAYRYLPIKRNPLEIEESTCDDTATLSHMVS